MDNLLTVKDAAMILQVRPQTLYQWIYAGKIKVRRLSPKAIRLTESDIKEFIDGGKNDGGKLR